MVNLRRLAVAAVLASVLLPGCGRGEDEGGGGGDAAEGEEIALLRKFPPSPSGGLRKAELSLVRDAAAWKALWARANEHLAPVPAAPDVDFGKEMVAVAALGEKSSGGFTVEIVGARGVGGKLRILYAEHVPAEGSATIQVITHPWHAVVLPRSDLPVEWVKYEAPRRK